MVMNPPDTDDPIPRLWDELPATFGTARAELLMELGHHLIHAERYDEALPVVQTAEELYLESSDDEALGRAAHNRAVIFGGLGRLDEQLVAESESIEHYERVQRFDSAGCSRMSLAQTLCSAGRLKEALPIFEAALENFTACDEPHHRANALMSLLDTNVSLGSFTAASRLLRPTFTATTQAAPIPVVARLHELAAEVLEVKHGTESATKALRCARAVWDAVDDETRVAACDIRIAVLAIADAPSSAARTLRSLRYERRRAGDAAGVAACDRGLGLVALANNKPRKAGRRFEDASVVFAACALFADAAECDALAIRAALAVGAGPEVIPTLRRTVKYLDEFHRPVAEVRARLDLAQVLIDNGEPRAAAREAKRAESVARRGILRPELAQATSLREQAQAALRAGDARH